MKKLYKISILLSFLIIITMSSIITYAANLQGIPQDMVQPDGTEIEVYAYGTEYFSYICDDEGNVLVENPDNGYIVYATLTDNEITPTDIAYGTSISGNTSNGGGGIDMLTSDEIPESIFAEAFQNSSLREKNIQENQVETMSLISDYDSFNDFELTNLVVFVRFKDKSFTNTTKSFYEGLLNSNSNSLKNYYNEASYGKLRVNSQMYPQSSTTKIKTYTDSRNISYYTENSSGYDRWEREDELVSNVMNYVSEYIPSELDLDKNNDGDIDMITIVLAGSIMSGENQIRWPHQTYYTGDTITVNGSNVCNYNIQIENTLREVSSDDGSYTFQEGSDILIHETLHIFGLPDLYYANFFTSGENNTSSMGQWDVMSKGQGVHMCSYLKQQYCNWIDIPEIKESGTYTLSPLGKDENCAYMLRSPRNDNEYFIIEYRRKTGSFEKNIPSTGIVVYRILADHRSEGNCYASTKTGTDDEIRQIYAKSSGSCSLKFSDGTSSGISVSDIAVSGDTATFNVSFPTDKNLYYFKDKNLVSVICDKLGKSESEITAENLQSIESLTIPGREYEDMPYDLSGIENLTNLKTLIANNCDIDNIDMLYTLANLEQLELNNNYIEDIGVLSNLTNLKILKLRGNMIDDYSPVEAYYENLTTKDFSLDDKNDVVFWVPNVNNGILGTAYIKCSSTRPDYIYYSLERYDTSTNELLKRRRERTYVSSSYSQKSITVPDSIYDDENSYIVLKTYENDSYRHLISESIIDGLNMDLGDF